FSFYCFDCNCLVPFDRTTLIILYKRVHFRASLPASTSRSSSFIEQQRFSFKPLQMFDFLNAIIMNSIGLTATLWTTVRFTLHLYINMNTFSYFFYVFYQHIFKSWNRNVKIHIHASPFLYLFLDNSSIKELDVCVYFFAHKL